MLVQGVGAVDPEQGWDGGRPDVEDPGVPHFAVDLHHDLKLFVPDDALCRDKGRGRYFIH